ncbi:hypothetical protein K458DRAFT_188441 [Lentithecium fluviatile CBS 122367]|uniref:Uncharacterized protein n=1 Tax=Lentithecium fluviatile CBS 122367 TaxID=1168545 RepID=A0A6G1JAL4_9PLEO|nr:hypothetical protein K458DRAFT_188441 [Lentithecium fluviatile CBS 122367]
MVFCDLGAHRGLGGRPLPHISRISVTYQPGNATLAFTSTRALIDACLCFLPSILCSLFCFSLTLPHSIQARLSTTNPPRQKACIATLHHA